MTSALDYMQRALALAAQARGETSPNPMVGCVLVRDGEVVGEGFHLRAGGPHAEIEALRMAGDRAQGADVYVSLEPCNHVGRTGPCAVALRDAGVRRVFVAMIDPNPKVSGAGIAALREAGIAVEVGLLEAEAQRLNEAFCHFIQKQRPFVSLKLAQSLDGRIALGNGVSQWITSEDARREAHRLRAEVDVVITGIGTVLADDPLLTLRHVTRRREGPLRLVVDAQLQTPPTAKLLTEPGPPVIIACTEAAPSERAEALMAAGARVWKLPSQGGHVDLAALLERLGREGFVHVLVEAGARLSAAFLDAGLVQKLQIFVAPTLIASHDALPALSGASRSSLSQALLLRDTTWQPCGRDFLVTSYLAG